MTKEKAAFIAHPTDLALFKSYINVLKPERLYADELLLKLFEWTPPYSVKEFRALGFSPHQRVDAELFMVPFVPAMAQLSMKKAIDKIETALALAKSHGCTVAALGGFTSILVQNREQDLEQTHRIRITSGNSLTAALIIRSVEKVALMFQIPLTSITMAIIGASGDIGSACAEYFCTRVRKLLLSARSASALETIGGICSSRAPGSAEIIRDQREALQSANCCIFVTSAHGFICTAEDFRPGTIVCDASAPVNVMTDGKLRDDVFLYHGGIAEIPFRLDLEFDLGLASPSTFYGCQLEGLFCALHPELPCSWGRGNISPAQLEHYFRILELYPSVKPAFTINNTSYDQVRIHSYADRWHCFN